MIGKDKQIMNIELEDTFEKQLQKCEDEYQTLSKEELISLIGDINESKPQETNLDGFARLVAVLGKVYKDNM